MCSCYSMYVLSMLGSLSCSALSLEDNADGVGMAGGCPWTKNWLTFDNSYFSRYKDARVRRFWGFEELGA